MTGNRWDVVIVGAGMAGLATAIWARRLGLEPLVLEREGRAGGQLNQIGGRIFDYPGLDLPSGEALTQRLVRQAEEAGATLRLGLPSPPCQPRPHLRDPRGPVTGRALVIATGLSARRLGVDGEQDLYRADGSAARPTTFPGSREGGSP